MRLRFGEENRAGIHLASLGLATFEPAKSGAMGYPHLTGIHTQSHAANISTTVLICHYLYTKRITKFNTGFYASASPAISRLNSRNCAHPFVVKQL